MEENKEFVEEVTEVTEEAEKVCEEVCQCAEESLEAVVEAVEETEETEETCEETAEDVASEVKSAINDVKETVSNSVKELLDKLNSADLSKEALKGHLENLTKNVNETVAKAGEKVNSLKEDPKTAEVWQKAKDAYTSASETVVKGANEVYGKAMSNENVKNAVEKVSEKAKEVGEVAGEKYQQFVHDPKVRETVVSAVGKVSALFGKVTSAVKDVLNNENTEETEEEKVEEE